MMELDKAKIIAQDVRRILSPYCIRIEVAGSIRRERREIGDVEIVCIPKVQEIQDGLFDKKLVVNEGFIKQVNEWEKVKGEPTGKYTQRKLPRGIALDLFICGTGNWGLIFAIRTGSAEFSHKILIGKINRAGYKSQGGILFDGNGEIVPMPEEDKLFDMIGMEARFYDPKNREVNNG